MFLSRRLKNVDPLAWLAQTPERIANEWAAAKWNERPQVGATPRRKSLDDITE
jgi:hypothetical protein